MSHKQPCSAQYSWQHTGRLQNSLPLISSAPCFSTADVLQSAMHAVGLPSVYSRPNGLKTFSLSSNAICQIDTVSDVHSNGLSFSTPLSTPKATSSPSAVRFVASQSPDDSPVDSDVTVHNTSHSISHFDLTTDQQTSTQFLWTDIKLSAATQFLAEEASQTSPVTVDSHNITLHPSFCIFMNNATLHKTAHVHALLHRNNFISNIIANHGNANRLLTVQELRFIQSCIDCDFWPISFSHLTTVNALVHHIIQWCSTLCTTVCTLCYFFSSFFTMLYTHCTCVLIYSMHTFMHNIVYGLHRIQCRPRTVCGYSPPSPVYLYGSRHSW